MSEGEPEAGPELDQAVAKAIDLPGYLIDGKGFMADPRAIRYVFAGTPEEYSDPSGEIEEWSPSQYLWEAKDTAKLAGLTGYESETDPAVICRAILKLKGAT